MVHPDIGIKLSDRRNEIDLTQVELALKADVSPSAIQKLERGEPASLRTVGRVARALGLDLEIARALIKPRPTRRRRLETPPAQPVVEVAQPSGNPGQLDNQATPAPAPTVESILTAWRSLPHDSERLKAYELIRDELGSGRAAKPKADPHSTLRLPGVGPADQRRAANDPDGPSGKKKGK